MNYYERHLGDYAKDTAHLTMIEHGAYGLLLDRYYATEQGIPADQAHRVARARTKEEKAAVDTVLEEFFLLIDGAWINNRTEEEITKAQSKIKAAQENGKRGGRPKKNQEETQEKPTGFPMGSETETQQKAHQTPDTSNNYSSSARGKIPNEPDATNHISREGSLCRQLMEIGIDANPTILHVDDWKAILAKRSDEQILEYARSKIANNPGKRLGLKYLAPGLLEDPEPIRRQPQQRRQPMSAVERVREANPLPGDIPTGNGQVIDIGGNHQ